MLIRLDNLVEGRTYATEKELVPNDSIKELIHASIRGSIRLKVTYAWANEELNVKISSQYNIDAHCDLCFAITQASCSCEIKESLTQKDIEYNRADNAFDITNMVEECVVLAVARTVRCKADCKGICPTCGCNLNKSTCDCDNIQDKVNPFGILKDLIITGGANNGSTKKKNIKSEKTL